MAERRTNLEILLSEWGELKARENRPGLGYPAESTFAQMRVDGQRRADPDVFLADDDIRRLDVAIGELHPDMRVVVTAHYIWAGPVKTKAWRLGIQPRVYYFHVEFAHKELANKLGGIYLRGYEGKLCTHVESECSHI